MVGNEDARAVGGDPLAVRLRRIDNLRSAVAAVEAGGRVRTSDRGNADLRRMEGRVDQKDQSRRMQRASRAHIHVGVAATEYALPGVLQRRVNHPLKGWRGTERAGP